MFRFSLIAMLYRGAFKVSVQDSLHYKSHLQANSSNNLLLLYYYLPNWHISHKILKNIGGNSGGGFNAVYQQATSIQSVVGKWVVKSVPGRDHV